MKNLHCFNLAFAVIFLIPAIALGESRLEKLRSKLPAPGDVLIDADAQTLLVLGGDGKAGTSSVVPVDQPDLDLSQAIRVTSLERGQTAWDVQVLTPTTKLAVHSGDVIFFAIDARCI
jgi:hypothetical protein